MGKLFRANSNGTYVAPGIASVFLPGLGQLFKGQVGKALLFFGVFLGWGIVSWFFGWFGFLGGTAAWLAGAFLWLINVLDALFTNQS